MENRDRPVALPQRPLDERVGPLDGVLQHCDASTQRSLGALVSLGGCDGSLKHGAHHALARLQASKEVGCPPARLPEVTDWQAPWAVQDAVAKFLLAPLIPVWHV